VGYDRLTVGVFFFPELECLRVRGEILVPFVAQRSRSVDSAVRRPTGGFQACVRACAAVPQYNSLNKMILG
jgi:hypothetical protein